MRLSTTSTKTSPRERKESRGFKSHQQEPVLEILELIRQRGAARAAGNYQLTSEPAKRCREAIKEYLKERQAAVLAEATEEGKASATPAKTSPTARPRCPPSGAQTEQFHH
ncbi:hypothetical protein ANCCAN_17297 [Ancylostoma caninum]|uniref:Uncharacterized protein n=1 Tax=Ancylostoma caninum TaxID=29170 RepID=A0A368G0L7_ANCCA|nr:hypothetical protein ANCCAN_17297 [Ancylostoma caninum]